MSFRWWTRALATRRGYRELLGGGWGRALGNFPFLEGAEVAATFRPPPPLIPHNPHSRLERSQNLDRRRAFEARGFRNIINRRGPNLFVYPFIFFTQRSCDQVCTLWTRHFIGRFHESFRIQEMFISQSLKVSTKTAIGSLKLSKE